MNYTKVYNPYVFDEPAIETLIKVKYKGCSDDQVRWGSNDDPRGILVIGKEYSVQKMEVHSWHTKYWLWEHPNNKFNSANFEMVE